MKRSLGRRIMDWLVLHGRRRYSIFALSGVSVGDFFVPALPTQTSVMALALLQPKRALLIVASFSLAAVVGAAILATLLLSVESYISSVQPATTSEIYEEWLWIQEFIKNYGLWGLLAFSMLPTPPRLMIATTVLAGFAFPLILATVFLGKVIWFGTVVTLLRHAPDLLTKAPFIGKRIQSLRERYSDKN